MNKTKKDRNKVKDLLGLPKSEITFKNLKTLNGCRREFSVYSEKWPTLLAKDKETDKSLVDHVNIAFADIKEGTAGEFSISFEIIGNKLTPKLECYSDAFKALMGMPDLLAWLYKNEYFSPQDLKAVLIKMGYHCLS